MTRQARQRLIASATAWLDLEQTRELMRMLLKDELDAATALLDRWVPDLTDELDLKDPEWVDLLLDVLDLRLAPAIDEPDQELVETQELPDYARFAKDER